MLAASFLVPPARAQDGKIPFADEKIFLIAHAGGAYLGTPYTNSIEALEANYQKGFRAFELDFAFTSDNRLVLVHDWPTFHKLSFVTGIPTYREFVDALMKIEVTPTTLEMLSDFLEKHPDAYVISDFKTDEIAGLTYIAKNYPAIQGRILPYIFSFDHYAVVQRLGYRNLILAVYLAPGTDDEIVKFSKTHDLFAVAIPKDRVRRSHLVENLSQAGIRVFVHTYNNWPEVRRLHEKGACGFMSDTLDPVVTYSLP